MMRDEGYDKADFDLYLLLGDQVTLADATSFSFLRHYLTEPECASEDGGLKVVCAGLRINPERIVAIPGNHDKLLQTNLDIYNEHFIEPLGLTPFPKQSGTITVRQLEDRDIIFISVDASVYADEGFAVDLSCRDHLARGYVSDVMEAEVVQKLRRLQVANEADAGVMQHDYSDALKILVVHYAVNLGEVMGPFAVMQRVVLPHGCKGLDRMVSTLKKDFSLDLVVHGHLHRPVLYTSDGVPVISATTTTQSAGPNGFHLVKFLETGDVVAEYHSWNGITFAPDADQMLSRTVLVGSSLGAPIVRMRRSLP